MGKDVLGGASSMGRSAVSRRFVKETETALAELLARDLSEEKIMVLMLDGEHLAGRCVIVALGITADGRKLPVGRSGGATENKTVVRSMLSDLVSRGLSADDWVWPTLMWPHFRRPGPHGLYPDDGLLVVIDGAKALHAAVDEVFGTLAAVQSCTLHKRRNVADHLPDKEKA